MKGERHIERHVVRQVFLHLKWGVNEERDSEKERGVNEERHSEKERGCEGGET